MADAMVLEVQQWLNATYGNVSGFEAAPENGLTGWPTIYSLRMGLLSSRSLYRSDYSNKRQIIPAPICRTTEII